MRFDFLFKRRRSEREKVILSCITADPWLMYCARFGASSYGFDKWWRLASFDHDVVRRFNSKSGGLDAPSKNEIARILDLHIKSGQDQYSIVGTALVRDA